MRSLLPYHGSLLILALGAAACEESGYDAAHGCEQLIACARKKGEAVPDRVTCEKDAEAYYNSLSRARRREASKAFDACRPQKGCDFDVCLVARSPR